MNGNERKARLQQYVLGAVLLDWKRALELQIVETDFSGQYRRIFQAVMRVATTGEPDAVALMEALPSRHDRETATLLLQESTGANTRHYLDELREINRREAVLALAAKAVESGGTASEISGALVSGLVEIFREPKAKAFDAAAMTAVTIDHLERLHDAKHGERDLAVPSGIGYLDEISGGLHPKDLVVVGARPGMGKTALMLSVALHAALRGYKVGIVSTEMGVAQIGTRFTSMLANLNAEKLRTMDLTEAEWSMLSAATGRLQRLPIFLLDQSMCRPSDIALQAKQWRMAGGLDLLAVDYLTRLKPDRKADRKDLEIGEIAEALKSLARDMDIPIMLLAQLSRDVEKRQDKRPVMADLRESGMVEQEADQVWMLYRPAVYDDSAGECDAEIGIEKNRHGRTGSVKCSFTPHTMRWADTYSGYDSEFL